MSTLNLEDVIDHAPFGRLSWLVLLLTLLALVFDGFDIQAIAFAAPALIHDWSITKADLSGVLAWGLMGMALGALVVGELGDRFGRRRATVVSLFIIAIATFFAAHAEGLKDLAVWRFLTGIGLGGTLPNATALIVEFSNRRARNLAVAVTVVGVPLGGMLGAALAAQVIPVYGWRGIFLLGAALPAALAVWAVVGLPESPRFLALQPGAGERLAALMNRVVGEERYTGREHWQAPKATELRRGVLELFRPEFRYNTIVIWMVFMTNVLTVYSFFNWVPALLSGAGLSLPDAIRGSLWFNLGGVVAAVLGARFMATLGSRWILGLLAGVGVVTVAALGQLPLSATTSLVLLYTLMTVAGGCISGLQVNMYTVTAAAYPTHLRATGVGAGLASARLGGIFSAFTGPVLASMGGGPSTFFSGLALVLALTFIATLLLRCHLPPVRRSA
jgi:AAHS family 4-hydroxybenzoate transporter-like MFS transporter